MAEVSDKKEEGKPGLYTKAEPPIDVSRAKIQDLLNLNKVSERTGIDFPLDGDKNTITPERFVVVPGKKQPKSGKNS